MFAYVATITPFAYPIRNHIYSLCMFLTVIHVIILWHGVMNIHLHLAVPWEPSQCLLYL